MTQSLPRVDALLPAYRAEAFIEATLDALAAQTYPNLRILISDDASPDRTAQLCEDFAGRVPGVRFIRQSRNLGWIGNSNALLAAAEGEFLFFALHDDLPHPQFVERMVQALTARPSAVAAFSDLEHITLRRGARIRRFTELDGVEGAYRRARIMVRRQGCWWVSFRSVIRSDAARRVGGLRKHFGGDFCSDFNWLLGLATQGEFLRVPEVLMTKRQQAGGVSKRWRYDIRERSGLLWGCVREIQRAPLTSLQRLRLQALAVTSAGLRVAKGGELGAS